jgi:hypothetical protein
VTLLREVAELLKHNRISHALIGAAALAAHGVGRSTLDIDLLTTDSKALDATLWTPLPSSDVRRGDRDDPLAGVVRIERSDQQVVDVVVGRSAWQAHLVERAALIEFEDTAIPLVDVPGLILLKLFAGSPQDAWDIQQLLAASERDAIVPLVAASIGELPKTARDLWRKLST